MHKVKSVVVGASVFGVSLFGMVAATEEAAEAHVTKCTRSAEPPKVVGPFAEGTGRAYCFSMHKAGEYHDFPGYVPGTTVKKKLTVSDKHRLLVNLKKYVTLPGTKIKYWKTVAYATSENDSHRTAGTVDPSLYVTAIADCGDGINVFRTDIRHEIWGIGGYLPMSKEGYETTVNCDR